MNPLLIKYLSENNLFREIEKSDITKLNEKLFVLVSLSSGEVLTYEDTPSTEVLLIVDGEVVVFKNIGDNFQVAMVTRGKGEFIGEMGIMENKPRSTTVVAKTHVIVIRISKDDFFFLLNSFPRINKNINQTIAERLRQANERAGFEMLRYQNLLELNQEIIDQKKELNRLNKELINKNEELKNLLNTDYLTGINNRKFILEKLNFVFKEIISQKRFVSLVLMDIDYFKKINDRFGHQAGDMALIEISTQLSKLLPKNCYLSRFGGEEFIALLIDFSLEEAVKLAETMRKSVKSIKIAFGEEVVALSISLGVNTYSERILSIDQFINETDKAMYFSKNNGRDRVTIFSVEL
jgi:diguanylate cyclase (GGDEF)-like protein